MGGTGGPTSTGATTPTTGAGQSTLAANPNQFAGSRASLDTTQTPDWLSGLLSTTSPAAMTNASPLAVNPTAAATQAGTPPAGWEGFTHAPYPTGEMPHIGAPDKPPPAPAAPAAPAAVPMKQIWPPAGGGTTAQWLASNPGWETDFNRAEQRADGSWWAPTDPNAPSPGPKYLNGGNITYQYSPPHG